MKYQLIKPINKNYSIIETILTNRSIPIEEVSHYLNTSDKDINDFRDFGEDLLKQGAKQLIKTIQKGGNVLVVVDCDCDGFTASALLLNYLHELFPSFVENNLKWYVHDGKQHGLSDCMDYINSKNFNLIITPDAGSNDIDQHKELKEQGKEILILDHHITDTVSPYAITINNQISNYPNKELSGVGVTWQFCRYIDSILGIDVADKFLDLVALGLTGDMMSLTSIETKHLINKGFQPSKIINPYIYEMWQKNKFKLGDHITSIDAAFYIVPMINAVQRSGTIEEKELLFNSMLKYKAFEIIPSTKRGCKGQTERLVDQAVRMSTNVKNRQTRTQDAEIEMLEKLIEKNNMLDNHKVLLFTLQEGEVDKNIAGLIANKFANKYQRPCCMLTKTIIQKDNENDLLEYSGSARGYEMSGITNFKDICDAAGATWTAGHQNAFGIGISSDKLETFVKETDKILKDMSSEPIYYVDYIYNGADVNPQDILTISSLGNLWGKDFNESLVAIENLKVEKSMVQVFRKSSNTLKITLPNKISLMKFNATEEECEKLENQTSGYIQINLVGKCHTNEYFGNITPQIFIEDYEITGEGKYLF